MATAEATESTREFSSDTQELGDRIVGLTLKAAKELSDYLDEVHGIKPASGGAVMVAGGGGAGGDGGGELVASGTPEDVVKVERSYTGQFLKELLERRPQGGGRQAAE